jgi:GNAT superfamily N-acetyltransferase
MIRKARVGDLEGLLRLYDQLRSGVSLIRRAPTRPDAVHQEALKKLMADKSVHVLVYQSGKKIVGTCTAYILPRLYRGRPLGVLDTIVVDSDSRGHGVGRKLIEEAAQICRKAGCGQVNLTSNTQRVRAHRFYESLGFEPTYIGFRRALQ